MLLIIAGGNKLDIAWLVVEFIAILMVVLVSERLLAYKGSSHKIMHVVEPATVIIATPNINPEVATPRLWLSNHPIDASNSSQGACFDIWKPWNFSPLFFHAPNYTGVQL